MSTSSDCRLVRDDCEDSDSVFLPQAENAECYCTCTVEVEQPSITRLKRENPDRRSQRSRHSRHDSSRSHHSRHDSLRSHHSRHDSTRSNRSKHGSQKRHGSQRRTGPAREGSKRRTDSMKRQCSKKLQRHPSHSGSVRDKKRLLSEQKSDCSNVETADKKDRPRRAVQIIITVAVLLTVMSVTIVVVTLLTSGKMEEMVKQTIQSNHGLHAEKHDPDAKILASVEEVKSTTLSTNTAQQHIVSTTSDNIPKETVQSSSQNYLIDAIRTPRINSETTVTEELKTMSSDLDTDGQTGTRTPLTEESTGSELFTKMNSEITGKS